LTYLGLTFKILDMFNNKGESKMNNLKIDVIKKVLMLDTKKELSKVLDFVVDSISKELDNDEKDQKAFEQWKAEKEIDETK